MWATTPLVAHQRCPRDLPNNTGHFIVYGYPPEPDGKTLLLKTPYLLVTRHGGNSQLGEEEAHRLGRIFASYTSEKGLIFRIYKKLKT